MKRTIVVEHLARVEGHGGVTVELDGDSVADVRFDIFEGARLLEGLVRGRTYEDISQVLSRICAICSVAHSLTSIKATENAFGVKVSEQTEILRDLMWRGENIESHALHIFLLAVPDYLGYPSALALAADYPEAVRLALKMKKLGNSVQETIGGRAVHPVNAVVGGFGRVPEVNELIALRRQLQEGMADVDVLVDLLASLPPADFCRSESLFAALRSPGGYGYFLGDEIEVVENGGRETILAPEYRTLTNETAVPHSHAKHSAYRGKPFMVGALARLMVNQEKLGARAAAAMEKIGLALPSANPMDNNKAQAVELVHDTEHALGSVDLLLDNGPARERPVEVRPRAGTGTAVTEAPRGILIHSYAYDDEGRLVSADVITPTALNAASVEERLRCAVEQSAGSDDGELARKLEMIVRAYDPCISCSVHLVRKRHAD